MFQPFFQPVRMQGSPSGITWFDPEARPLFERALILGRLHRLRRRLSGQRTRLLLLADAAPDYAHRLNTAAGAVLQSVTLRSIVGTVNRDADFDDRFFPLNTRVEDRWVRLASMMLHQAVLPPIEVVALRGQYFVIDGHHRISVTYALRGESVDALVIATIAPP